MRWVTGVVVVALACAVVACGEDEDAGSSASSGEKPEKQLKIAFLAATTNNPPQTASFNEMKKVAAESNATVTAMDGELKPATQFNQLQQIAATKQYDGVIVTPLDGASLVPAAKKAIDAGVKVAAMSIPLGPSFDSADPQVPGLAISVLRPPPAIGEQVGQLTVDGCEGIDPCEVALLHAVKALPFDQAIFKGFEDATKDSPNIKVVTEAETQASAEGGRKAIQNVLQGHSGVDVMVGWSQSLLGGAAPLKSAGKLGKIKLAGINGSNKAVDQIASGDFGWLGLAAVFPQDEGRAAIEGLIKAIRDGEEGGGVDVNDDIPDNGLITKDNADEFVGRFPE